MSYITYDLHSSACSSNTYICSASFIDGLPSADLCVEQLSKLINLA